MPESKADSIHTVPGRSSGIRANLRRLLLPWGVTMLLPFPILFTESTEAADIGTLYLGIGAAWLALEAFRPCLGAALTPDLWSNQIISLSICLVANALIFAFLGTLCGIPSAIPLPLMALFGVVPAIGLVPWLTLRLRQPYGAILVSALLVAGTKLSACVVARLVYGPDYIAQGYVSADWNTAKLMISLMWAGTLLLSGFGLLASRRWLHCRQP